MFLCEGYFLHTIHFSTIKVYKNALRGRNGFYLLICQRNQNYILQPLKQQRNPLIERIQVKALRQWRLRVLGHRQE